MTIEAASLAAEISVEGAAGSTAALVGFGRTVEQTAARQAGAAIGSRRHEQALRDVGTAGLIAGGALTAAFVGIVGVTANFDRAMSGVAAVTSATDDQLGLLRETAIQAGKDTVFSASQAATAEAELAKAGVDVADIAGGALRGALGLAAAGQIDLANAATITAQGLNIFNLEGRDAAHVADVLAAGANKSAADVAQLGDALRQGGLLARQTGLSLEDTVGILALFADNALIGSDAGTSLKTMLQRLTPQSDEARETMDRLGISAYDAQGNFVGLEAFAENLRQSLSGLTQEQRNAALATIFGTDAVRAASLLYDAGASGVRDYVTAVDDQGAATRMASVQLNNLSGDLEQLKGSLETALISGGSQATGALRGMTQATTGLVNAFVDAPAGVQKLIVGFTGISGASLVAVGGIARVAAEVQRAKIAFQGMSAGATVSLALVSAALIGGGIALADWAKKKEEARQRTLQFTDALRADSGELGANTQETIRNSLAQRGLLDDLGQLQGHLSSGRAAFDVYVAGVEGSTASQRELRRAIIDSDQAGLDFGQAQPEFARRVKDEWVRSGGDIRVVFARMRQEYPLLAQGATTLNVAHQNLMGSVDQLAGSLRDGQRAFETEQRAAKDSAAIDRDVAAATTQLRDAVALHGETSDEARAAQERLTAARDRQAQLDKVVADAQRDVTSTAQAGTGAVNALGGAAAGTTGDLNALSDAGYNAAAGIGSIGGASLAQFDAQVQAGDSAERFAGALYELDHAGDAAAGGVGGSGRETKTAAQQYFEAADKARALDDAQRGIAQSGRDVERAERDVATAERAVDDAHRGVAQAARDATDAQADLARAQRDAELAGRQLAETQERVNRILRGQPADSKDAKDAAEELSDAQRDAAEAQLAIGDAQAQLDETRKRSADDVARAERHAVAGRKGAAEELAAAQDKAARDNAHAQLNLEDAQDRAEDAANRVAEAQRLYNGTVAGFPAESKEAIEATDALADAQDANAAATRRARDAGLAREAANRGVEQADRDLEDATRGVTDAQLALEDAHRNVGRSALELQRAEADARGELDNVSGSAGGAAGHVRALADRQRDAAASARQWATDQANASGAIEGTAGWTQTLLDKLLAIVAARPDLHAALDPLIEKLRSDLQLAASSAGDMRTHMQDNFGFGNAKPDTLFDGMRDDLEKSAAAAKYLYDRRVDTFGFGFAKPPGKGAAGAARGGTLAEGYTWVGEEGPELAYNAGSRTTIYSHSESRHMVASSMMPTASTTVDLGPLLSKLGSIEELLLEQAHRPNWTAIGPDPVAVADEIEARTTRRVLLRTAGKF